MILATLALVTHLAVPVIATTGPNTVAVKRTALQLPDSGSTPLVCSVRGTTPNGKGLSIECIMENPDGTASLNTYTIFPTVAS